MLARYKLKEIGCALIIAASAPTYAQEKSVGFFSRVTQKVINVVSPKIRFSQSPPEDFFSNPLPHFRKLPHDTLVTLFTPEERLRSAVLMHKNLVFLDTNMEVYLNNEYDAELLRKSMRNGGAETAFATAYDRDGNPLRHSAVVIGNKDSVGMNQINAIVDTVFQNNSDYLIDIVHTHPNYEYRYQIGSHQGVRSSQLSGPDLYYAAEISETVPQRFVRIRAVLPNGYNYSTTFKNGQRVPDPIYQASAAGRETLFWYFKRTYPNAKLTDEVKRQILEAGDFNQLKRIARDATQSNAEQSTKSARDPSVNIEKILEAALVNKNSPNYESQKANAALLVDRGVATADVIKEIAEFELQLKLNQVMHQVDVAMYEPSYVELEDHAKKLLEHGQSEAVVEKSVKELRKILDILAVAKVAKSSEHYEAQKSNVAALVGQGLSHEEVLKEITDFEITLKVSKALFASDIAIHEKDYFDLEDLAKKLVREGKNIDEIERALRVQRSSLLNGGPTKTPTPPKNPNTPACEKIFL